MIICGGYDFFKAKILVTAIVAILFLGCTSSVKLLLLLVPRAVILHDSKGM